MSLSELFMPRHVSSVDLILQENGLTGPTINYSLQRDNLPNANEENAFDQIKILAPRRIEKPTNRRTLAIRLLGLD